MENIVNSIPEWVRKDIAIEVIAEVLADKSREIEREEQKENPDLNKLQQLEEEERNLLKERQEMYFGNTEVIRKILIEYGEKVRKKYVGE
jgi:hypothetical protein